MKKREFMERLAGQLGGIERDERRNILNYYNELIDDKLDIGESEERIIMDLGPISEIVRKLNISREITKNKIRYDYEAEMENKQAQPSYQPKKVVEERKYQKVTRKGRSGWAVLAIILTFPIWFPVLAAIFSVALALIIAIFAIQLSGAILMLAGIAGIVASAFTMGVELELGLFNMGASIAIVGVGMILMPILATLSRWLWKCCKGCFTLFRSKKKRGNDDEK